MIVLYAFCRWSLLVASTISYDNLAFALTGDDVLWSAAAGKKSQNLD